LSLVVATPMHARSVPVPRERLLADEGAVWEQLRTHGWCYPGEAARILRVPTVDYRQLRVIYALVREMSGGQEIAEPLPMKPGQKRASRPWARFTLRDLACAAEVVRLCVEPVRGSPEGRGRLNVAKLRNACTRLQKEGMTWPLLEVTFEWDGAKLVAMSNKVRFDAATGQLLLAGAAGDAHGWHGREPTPRLARLIRQERAAVRKAREQALRLDRSPPRTSGMSRPL
jgi:hypothetical protein